MAKNVPTTIRFLHPATGDVLRCGNGTQRKASQQINFLTSEYVMLYMTKGKAFYSDAHHARVPIEAGDVWQRFPNVVHSVVCLDECHWYFVAVPAGVMHLLEVTGITTLKQIAFHIGNHPSIIRRYEQVHHRLTSGPHSQLPYCLLAMQQLMVDLHLLARNADLTEQSWLDRARQMLSRKLDQRIKTEQVADALNMTYANFRKQFTHAIGMSPGQFRIRQRIQQAQEQLAGTHTPIADIAQSLGYPDVYSFSAQFAKHAGMPPAQYRRQWQWDDRSQ